MVKVLKIAVVSLFFGAFMVYFYRFDPSIESGHFLACPVQYFLGWDCPGCGSQRLIHNLLHLNFREAFQDNALLFISFPFVLYILGIFIANHLFKKSYRIPLFYNNNFVWGLFILLIGFGILRNLPLEPFCYLASPQ